MTDTEAKEFGEVLTGDSYGDLGKFIRHALRAIEDRAKLCTLMSCVSLTKAQHNLFTAACRHMNGEE